MYVVYLRLIDVVTGGVSYSARTKKLAGEVHCGGLPS
jgi:hypothetical protein